jgi:Putative  PD-(D/E)XK family member, (DUF4420)
MDVVQAIRLALDGSARALDESYSICIQVSGCFVGWAPSGCPALLIPLASDARAPGRMFEGLIVDFPPRLRFDFRGQTWEAPAAVLECIDPSLTHTFCALAADLAARLPSESAATSRDVLIGVSDWEALLRSQSRLSETEELGLWGELWFLRSLPNSDYGIKAWRGPDGFAADFFAGGLGIDCKASRARLRHDLSHDQVAADREFPMIIVSMWVGPDPAGGRTVAELVHELDAVITDRVSWELRLLKAGYRRSADGLLQTKFALLDAPRHFRDTDIPRVRTMDPGVRHLRYTVEIDAAKALSKSDWENALAQFLKGSP